MQYAICIIHLRDILIIIMYFLFSDDNRDIHSDDDLKRQRLHYSGDQLYSNVSIQNMIKLDSYGLIKENISINIAIIFCFYFR